MRHSMVESLVIVCEADVDWLTDDGVRLMPLDSEEWLQIHKKLCPTLSDIEHNILLLTSCLIDVVEQFDDGTKRKWFVPRSQLTLEPNIGDLASCGEVSNATSSIDLVIISNGRVENDGWWARGVFGDQRYNAPTLSAYPLGAPWGNEWQYFNFSPDDNTDKAHFQTLYDIICSGEFRAIASACVATQGNVIYKRYFPRKDDDDDFQGHVKSVLLLIAGDSTDWESCKNFQKIKPLIHDSMSLDFAGTCADSDATLAYTSTDKLDKHEKIHFCEIAGAKTNAQTRSTYSVGPQSTLRQQIKDMIINADSARAYDPHVSTASLTLPRKLTRPSRRSMRIAMCRCPGIRGLA
ncbi:hypothetical protein GGR55DRAFT_696039 [Xylaria sp. FL0064]|nr:hypothetical protein GGR55DRAFT_696039 [Xylaria sp. FL0064]